MKQIKYLLVFNFIMILMGLIGFLASNDIAHDYIGNNIKNIITQGVILPEWSSCNGEWYILQVEFIIRFIFLLVNAFFLYKFSIIIKKNFEV
ncbi:MAG: hypothetical protein WC002_06995 [Candidatus Muiribacteriota bacterium]